MPAKHKLLAKRRAFCDKKSGWGPAPISGRNGRLLAARNQRIFSGDRPAKRPANIGVFFRSGVLDALRRMVPEAAVLQPAVSAPTVGTDSPTTAPLERLSSGRSQGFVLGDQSGRAALDGREDPLRAGQWGTFHPGIAALLGAEQNPLARMAGQCRVPATAAVGLQFGPRVQTFGLAPSISAGHRRDDSAGVPGVASQTDQAWQSQRAAIAPRLSSPAELRGGRPGDRKIASAPAQTGRKIRFCKQIQMPHPHFPLNPPNYAVGRAFFRLNIQHSTPKIQG